MTLTAKETPEEMIARLEAAGRLSPTCAGCQEAYASIREFGRLPFAPSHKAMDRCESGKRAHCTCDTCF